MKRTETSVELRKGDERARPLTPGGQTFQNRVKSMGCLEGPSLMKTKIKKDEATDDLNNSSGRRLFTVLYLQPPSSLSPDPHFCSPSPGCLPLSVLWVAPT